jgi:YfiH family protein
MIRKEKNGIEWLEYELFAPYTELLAAVILRHGGVSQGVYSSLNVGEGADIYSHVAENRRRLSEALNLGHLSTCGQPHRDEIALVPDAPDEELRRCDGLCTITPNRSLLIKHADCQAAIFYDPHNRALASVHAGWRGQVRDIYRKTIAQMEERFKSDPAHLLVALSPSLGPEHAEFIHYRKEWPPLYWEFQTTPNHFDLWNIAEMQLLQAGIKKKNIQIPRICTYTNKEDFYSFRRDSITGRNATVASLLPI